MIAQQWCLVRFGQHKIRIGKFDVIQVDGCRNVCGPFQTFLPDAVEEKSR